MPGSIEKGPENSVRSDESPPLGQQTPPTLKDPDQAYRFLQEQGAATPGDDGGDGAGLAALRRKVDWHLVPIMFCCYTMQFIDKVLLNVRRAPPTPIESRTRGRANRGQSQYAAVMGLPAQLKLQGNDFSNAATAFFIAYLIAEIPNGLILNKVPAGKWLGANVVLWGIATACTAAATNYSSLLAARIFLGIFEAAIAPSLMLVSSQWYTRAEQAPRFSFWYTGLGIGQIVGGIVSFAFQQIQPGAASLSGWRIMFVVLGLVTVIIGAATVVFLPDSPMTARFLSDREKAAIIRHVVSVSPFELGCCCELTRCGGCQSNGHPEPALYTAPHARGPVRSAALAHGPPDHPGAPLYDPFPLSSRAYTPQISVSSGVVTTYSATLIQNFGYRPPIAALLNMPSGLVSIASTLIVGFGVRRTSHRWAWLAGCCVPGILGGGLLSFAPATNRAALLAGIYLVNAVVATLTIIYQWTAANVAGHTKRVVSVALVAASFSVGNIIGPQTFQARDAPQFVPAKIAVLATQAAGALVAVLLFAYYVWENRRRDARFGKVEAAKRSWENVTDRENESFRYVY